MKNVVTISDIMFGKPFENKNGIDTQLVNLNTVEKIHQFKMNEDGEKKGIEKAQIAINFSNFTRMLVLDQWLALMPTVKLSDEQEALPKAERDAIVYANHLRVLRGAKVTISRTEDTEVQYDETKPLKDEKGEPVLKDGEQVYEELKDENDKVVKKVVGYRDLEVVAIELTPAASKLAQHLAFA